MNLEITANSYNYIIRNGLENFRRLPQSQWGGVKRRSLLFRFYTLLYANVLI